MTQFLQVEAGRTRISVAPQLGGRIAQIEALHHGTWVSLLQDRPETPAEDRDPLSWGSFVMAPWPNRIDHGRFTWRTEAIELPPNLGPHAIHGLCFDRPWTVQAVTSPSCELSITLDDRWPFGGHVVQRIEALDDGVAQTITVGAGKHAFPAGVGWHPWFRRDIAGSAHVHAQVHALERYELQDGIPTGKLLPIDDGRYDLRTYPELGLRRLDDCYPNVSGTMRLRWDDLELWIESSANVSHAVVYTPEDAVCLEPQTCAVDAFNLGGRGAIGSGTTIVEPERPLVVATRWRWASAEPRWQQIHMDRADA